MSFPFRFFQVKSISFSSGNNCRSWNFLTIGRHEPISYIKDRLASTYSQKVSTPTIISRAKRGGFYLARPKRKAHDREVLTNYVGELIQHDSSHHKWSPYADQKWYLITSIDDCSRFLLYYKLIERETSWTHIEALEEVALNFGLAYCYYVDSHSIFRFVQGRDSLWRKHYKVTDEADPQWKQVLQDLQVKLIYALSAPAKDYASYCTSPLLLNFCQIFVCIFGFI